jgi:hypothetical protein
MTSSLGSNDDDQTSLRSAIVRIQMENVLGLP